MNDHAPVSPQLHRLGVYVDTTYALTDGIVAADPIDAPFLLFVGEVGSSFQTTLLFGRSRTANTGGHVLLPFDADLQALPDYESLRSLHGVLRVFFSTISAFSRRLDAVDVVWIFGPHPIAAVFALFAVVRRKRIVLGVRQDTVGYYRARLPGRSWRPAMVLVRGLDLLWRGLAQRIPTTVVGEGIARKYGSAASILPMTVSLVRVSDIMQQPDGRMWDDQIELLTVGRLEPEKNPRLLLETLALLHRERPGRYRLSWVGSGQLRSELEERAQQLGLTDLVRFEGYIPFGRDLLERYRRAHIFVHVSLTEGVPQVLVEALASGTPIVATAVGGVREALDQGRAGMLVHPGDARALVHAIERLTDEPGLRKALVARGIELARKRTLEREAARVAAFLMRGERPERP